MEPIKKEEQRIVPEYNFYSPYVQMYMQALAVRPPIYFPSYPYGGYGEQAGQPGYGQPGYPAGPYGYGGYDPYGMQPAPAAPATQPTVIRRPVRQKAVIFFAGLFALLALALSAFFFYVNGSLIPDFLDAFSGASGFNGILNVLGDNIPVVLVLVAAVFGLGALISAVVGLCSKKWQPVFVFTLIAFLAYAAACALDYFGDGVFDLLTIKQAYPYYCVAAAYLISFVLSWFCYPKRKFVLQEV